MPTMVTDIFTHFPLTPHPPPPPSFSPHIVKKLHTALYNQIILKQGVERLCPANNFAQGLNDDHDWFE